MQQKTPKMSSNLDNVGKCELHGIIYVDKCPLCEEYGVDKMRRIRCSKCKQLVNMKVIEKSTMKNGMKAIMMKCPKCKTRSFKITN